MDVHESDRSSENHPSNPAEKNSNNNATNRHGKSKSSWGLSTAVHGVGFVAKKVITNRYTDSLWHSKKSTSTSGSVPSDDAKKRENRSQENNNVHPLNVADEQTPKLPAHDSTTTGSNVIDQLESSKPEDGSHDAVDGSENTKPTFGLHVKPVTQYLRPTSSTTGSNAVDPEPSRSLHVNQHRWPSATSSNVVNQSENSDRSHARLVNQHLCPGTVGSNLLNNNINEHPPYEASKTANLRRTSFPNHASKPLPESTSDATNPQSSSSLVDEEGTRLKTTDTFIESQPSSPNKSCVLASRGARDSLSCIVIGVKPSPIVRGTSLTPTTRSANDTITEAIPTSTVRGSSHMLLARGVSPTPDTHTPIRPSSSPPKSSPLDKETGHKPTRALRWLKNPLSMRGVSPTPTRGVSPTPGREVSPTPSRGVSPTPTRGDGPCTRDISPTPVNPSKPSGRRHFFNANVLSVFTKMVDNRKEKNVTNLKEVAQHLELLYNIQVQWQFANASAEAALGFQRATAEKSLFDVWRTIFELRDSVASKKVDMELMILQLKLYAVIYRQMAYIYEWSSIQEEHELALFATTNDLQARSLSVPITGGVKADIRALKLIVFSTIQVVQAMIFCIESTVSKLDKTHFLASELANLVLHERALLDECELLLASATPLYIEECSLISYLLQSSRTSMTE